MSKKEIEEVKEFLSHDGQTEEKVTSIIYDKRQYSVRIPKKFAESLEINPKTDKFKFTLIIHPALKGDLPELRGEIIHGKEKKEQEKKNNL